MQKPVNPKEALKKRKNSENNRNLLLWSLVGIGVAINILILYNNYMKV
jgi:hypothetical protein